MDKKDVAPAHKPLSKASNNLNGQPTQPLRMVKSSQKRLLQVSTNALHDSVMAELWSTLISIYGKKWLDQYGDFIYPHDNKLSPTVNVWAEALSDVDLPRLARALRMCLDRECPFPPTLPEFKAMCARRPWE